MLPRDIVVSCQLSFDQYNEIPMFTIMAVTSSVILHLPFSPGFHRYRSIDGCDLWTGMTPSDPVE